MLVTERQFPELYDAIVEKNLLRQYDLLTNFIEIGIRQGPQSIDKYMLWALNHAAVAGISHFGGRFRQEPVYVGRHRPPPFMQVPELMDRFISFIHENWDEMTSTELAGYALWRLNWIHPFVEGNGRTARAVCYYLLCVKNGQLLPGRRIVPERIRDKRSVYFAALAATDAAWEAGDLDLEAMDDFLAGLLRDQLMDA